MTQVDDAAVRAVAKKIADTLKGVSMRHALLGLAIVLSYSLTRVRKDRREDVVEAVIGVVLGLHGLDLPDTDVPEEPLQ